MGESKSIRILMITGGYRKGVSGGIPSIISNYCKELGSGELQFDFLSLGYQTYEPYRQELEAIGGNLYCLEVHTTGVRRLLQVVHRLRKYLKTHEYDIVHVNSGSMPQIVMTALAAKMAGVKKVVAHSHNAIMLSKGRRIFYACIRPLFYLCTDDYFACAAIAAQSVFPKRIVERGKWKFVPNAIDTSRFAFDRQTRETYREQLKLKDSFVVGHVGRFNEQKNHRFLLEVFERICHKESRAMLLLVGTGELQPQIQQIAEEKGLSNRVIFAGQRRDANCMMQAMDVFLFPSLFEGLGMVLIEAQTAGLPVISSDRVPIKETKVTDMIEYLPLNDAEKWAEEALAWKRNEPRTGYAKQVAAAGYELSVAADKLKAYYKALL